MRRTAIILTLLLFAVSARADLLLGSVDKDKIKSFKNYFGQFYDVEHPIFEDKEFEKRIQSEAADIYGWISDESNWPENIKRTAELQADLAALYYYLGNAGIQKARNLSRSLKEREAESHPENADLQIEMFWFYKHLNPPIPEKFLYFAERALLADKSKAEAENIHYWIALELYHRGFFAQAKEHIEQQFLVNSEFEDTKTKKMIFNLMSEQWGFTPERVEFKEDADGVSIPVPLTTHTNEE